MIDEFYRAAFAVGCLVVFLAWESLLPFVEQFRSQAGGRGRHGIRNLSLGVLNAALNGLLCAGLWFGVTAWAETRSFGVLHWISAPSWGQLLGGVLLLDLWMYGWHRLNHRVPFLWRFHRVHHSDRQMDVTTASRFHFGEILLSCAFRAPVIALLGVEFWVLPVYEGAMFLVAQWHHANIGLPQGLDRALRSVVVTPFMHKMHHSRWRPETDSNYSAIFSFWDRLFQTFGMGRDPKAIRFGLDEMTSSESDDLKALLRSPLREPPSGGEKE